MLKAIFFQGELEQLTISGDRSVVSQQCSPVRIPVDEVVQAEEVHTSITEDDIHIIEEEEEHVKGITMVLDERNIEALMVPETQCYRANKSSFFLADLIYGVAVGNV